MTLEQLITSYNSKYSSEKVKEVLVTLLQYNYVSYTPMVQNQKSTNKITYKLAVEFILSELWHAQYCHYVGIKYGHIAKIIVLHLLTFGVIVIEQLFNHLIDKANVNVDNLIHTFRNLADDRIVIYHKNWLKDSKTGLDVIDIDCDDNADRLCFIHTDDTTLQEMKRKYEKEIDDVAPIISRKRRISDGLRIDENVPFTTRLVCANYNALTLLLQNEFIKEYATSYFDHVAAHIIGSILDYNQENRALYAHESIPVSFYNILRNMNKYNISEDNLKYYLSILSNDDFKNTIIKIGDNRMGEFSVNIASIFQEYLKNAMHTIVSHKYGSSAARICNTVLHYKYLDPKQISQLCLLDVNETQSLLQRLCKDQILDVTLIPKGMETRPLKSVCIIHSNIKKIAHVLKASSIEYINNLLTFRHDLLHKNRIVVEKGDKLYKLVGQVNNIMTEQTDTSISVDQNLIDQTNIMTDNEKKIYDNIQIHLNKIDISLAKLSQQYFLIKYYLKIVHSCP